MKNKFSIFMACLAMVISIPTSMHAVEKEGKEHAEHIKSKEPRSCQLTKVEHSPGVEPKVCDQLLKYSGPHEGAGEIERELSSQARPFNTVIVSTPGHERTLSGSPRKFGMEQFVKIVSAAKISNLDLSYSHIGSEGVEMMAHTSLPYLRTLDVHCSELGTIGARYLANNKSIQNLLKLVISSNQVEDSGAVMIALRLPQLQYLDISFNKIEVQGAKAIADRLKQLQHLDISFNAITREGVQFIADGLPQLQYLDISINGIRISGIEDRREIASKFAKVSTFIMY